MAEDITSSPAGQEGPEGQPGATAAPDRVAKAAPMTTHTQEQVFFLVADAAEGPAATVDPDVVTRRAMRAMDRLLDAR